MTQRELMIEFWHVWGEHGPAGLLDRYDEFFAEDFEWRPPIAGVLGTEYSGRDGWARYVADFGEMFSSFDGSTLTLSEVSPDLWTGKVRLTAVGDSGYEVDAILFAIVRFNGERMSYGWGTYDPELAETTLAAILEGEVPV